MGTTRTIHMPSPLLMVRHASRPLLESTLVPLALFAVVYLVAGFDAGLVAALAVTGLFVFLRLAWRQPVPAVLLLSLGFLVLRTVVGLVWASPFLYFLEPTLQNLLLAAILVLTLGFERPLLARLADDFCAFPDAVTRHPEIRRFFRRVSLLWAAVFAINGVTMLVVLALASVGNFLFVSTIGSFGLVGVGIVVSLVWFRRTLRAQGMRLRIRRGAQMPV